MSNTGGASVMVTVVAYNSDHCLCQCLSSVRESVRAGFGELVVVDNASPDQSARIVAEKFPEASLVRSEVNRGFAGGCNLAWPFVRSRYWLLLNPDVIVPANGLEELVTWMDQHPELGVGSPWLSNAEGRAGFVGRRTPSLSLALFEALRLHLLVPHRRRAALLLGPYWMTRRAHVSVDWVPATAMIVRREAVEAAGLLAENLPMYGEDVEWCWRIRKAGWRVGVCSDLTFRHDGGQSAIRTWGEIERAWRMWQGLYAACSRIHGITRARLLMAANALAFVIEAHHPRRPAAERAESKRHLEMHIALLRGRMPKGMTSQHSVVK